MVTSLFCTFRLKCISYNTYSLCLLLVAVAEYSQVHPEERISTVVETITVESRKEFVVEETVVQKFPKQIIPEQKISHPISEREDDWFVLLDVAAREPSFVPPGIVDIPSRLTSLFCHFCGLQWLSYNTCSCCLSLATMVAQVYREERISTVVETKTVESRKEVVVERIVVQVEDINLPKQIIQQAISQPIRQIDDDWFILLDIVSREAAYVPPGNHSLKLSLFLRVLSHQKKSGCHRNYTKIIYIIKARFLSSD